MFAAFLVTAGLATPAPMTLPEALDYARAHQPRIRAALASVAASKAEARVPRAAWLPQIGATAQLYVATSNNTTASYLGVPEMDIPRIGGSKSQTQATAGWAPSASSIAGDRRRSRGVRLRAHLGADRRRRRALGAGPRRRRRRRARRGARRRRVVSRGARRQGGADGAPRTPTNARSPIGTSRRRGQERHAAADRSDARASRRRGAGGSTSASCNRAWRRRKRRWRRRSDPITSRSTRAGSARRFVGGAGVRRGAAGGGQAQPGDRWPRSPSSTPSMPP